MRTIKDAGVKELIAFRTRVTKSYGLDRIDREDMIALVDMVEPIIDFITDKLEESE